MDTSLFHGYSPSWSTQDNFYFRECKFIFRRFIRCKLTFVKFWLRFDTALKCQRQSELIANNTSEYTTSELLTSWEIKRHGRALFTHEVFELFQAQVLAARDDCDVQQTDVRELKSCLSAINTRRLEKCVMTQHP